MIELGIELGPERVSSSMSLLSFVPICVFSLEIPTGEMTFSSDRDWIRFPLGYSGTISSLSSLQLSINYFEELNNIS